MHVRTAGLRAAMDYFGVLVSDSSRLQLSAEVVGLRQLHAWLFRRRCLVELCDKRPRTATSPPGRAAGLHHEMVLQRENTRCGTARAVVGALNDGSQARLKSARRERHAKNHHAWDLAVGATIWRGEELDY